MTRISTAPTTYDYHDFVHTGRDDLAGLYLRCFWQPCCRSEDLQKGRALPIKLMGESFTLYRGASGQPYAVAHRCAHRRTPLSTGYIEGEEIRCLFHGWKYDGNGQCVEQPAEPEPFCAKVQIQSYPVAEYLGLVFVYLGEGEPPPMHRYPDFEAPGLLEVREPEIWPCNFSTRTLDSAIDWSHVAFTHRHSALYKTYPVEQPQMAATETEYGVKGIATLPGFGERITYFHMPNVNQFHAPVDPTLGWVWHLAWRVPIDDESHIDFDVAHLPLVGEEAQRYAEERRARQRSFPTPTETLGERVLAGTLSIEAASQEPNAILVQDYVVQVGQGAIPERSGYRLGRADVGLIVIHKIWERELRALAEGKSLKQWVCPPGLNF